MIVCCNIMYRYVVLFSKYQDVLHYSLASQPEENMFSMMKYLVEPLSILAQYDCILTQALGYEYHPLFKHVFSLDENMTWNKYIQNMWHLTNTPNKSILHWHVQRTTPISNADGTFKIAHVEAKMGGTPKSISYGISHLKPSHFGVHSWAFSLFGRRNRPNSAWRRPCFCFYVQRLPWEGRRSKKKWIDGHKKQAPLFCTVLFLVTNEQLP